jgi:C1A family cysteine protease
MPAIHSYGHIKTVGYNSLSKAFISNDKISSFNHLVNNKYSKLVHKSGIDNNIIDLTTLASIPIYDQGNLGSCTSNAMNYCCEFYQVVHHNKEQFCASRLFTYYNSRVIENSIDTDSGAEFSDVVKAVQVNGLAREVDWPYDISKFSIKPPKSVYNEARPFVGITGTPVDQNITQLVNALQAGHPLATAVQIYDSFETDDVANTGIVPIPDIKNENLLGGHMIVIIGYDPSTNLFKFRNSWGDSWGKNGYGFLPESYVLNSDLTSEFWIIANVADVGAPYIDLDSKVITSDDSNIQTSNGVVNPLDQIQDHNNAQIIVDKLQKLSVSKLE